MTFIERIESLSERFLSDRTYELIVAPAIADVEFDQTGAAVNPTRDHSAVLLAFAGAVYEDLTSDWSVLTIAALALVPATYYYFLLMVISVPKAAPFFEATFSHFALAAALAVLSLAPVLVCCWPERTFRRSAQPDASDAFNEAPVT